MASLAYSVHIIRLTENLISQNSSDDTLPSESTEVRKTDEIDLKLILNTNIMGAPPKKIFTTPDPLPTPEATQRELKLVGVFLDSANGRSSALISVDNGPARLYFTDDLISNDLTVETIASDSVIFKSDKKREALFFPYHERYKLRPENAFWKRYSERASSHLLPLEESDSTSIKNRLQNLKSELNKK